MALYTLVIGSKNYSSWSMRAWIGLRHAGIEFDEITTVQIDTPYCRTYSRYLDPADPD